MNSTNGCAERRYTVFDSLKYEHLKLSYAAIRDVGPAAQTLAGLMAITNKETFVSKGKAAERARVPIRTARRHLAQLTDSGWIINKGRQESRTGRTRRSTTLRLTRKARDLAEPYGWLPWWGCNNQRFPWASRVVISMLMQRVCQCKAIAERQDHECDGLDMMLVMGDRLFSLSLRKIQNETGLSKPAIIDAKNHLAETGLIQWTSRKADRGGADADYLGFRNYLQIVEKDIPGKRGKVLLDFDDDPNRFMEWIRQGKGGW